MGTRSDVGLGVKSSLVSEINRRFPWVRVDADEICKAEEGELFIFKETSWNDVSGNIKELYDWLKGQDSSSYILVEACHDHPEYEGNLGCWEDNPWCLYKAIEVTLEYMPHGRG